MNDKFEELLCEYIRYVGGLSKIELPHYNVNYFRSPNKKQFVNLITKEVLFEVWVEGVDEPVRYLDRGKPWNPILCWKEYYK
tara:strand:+ start:228 stop:473 length:246 start_codon:yes stop_codon:yes gene_type:complete